MAITRIRNNQITDATIVAYAKVQAGSLTGNLFAPTVTLNSNVTINGNLFLSNTGNVTTINATNTYINDPLVMFNNGYTGSLTGYDIGILVNRNLASLGPYGSVNTAWVWVEADQSFEALATTDTGTGITSINSSGFANVKVGNLTTTGFGSIGGTLSVTGATTLTGATTFTTATGGGLQAVAIGNVTPGTGAFTTATATTVNAATIGNIGAKITGDGGFLSNIIAANVVGTVTTANVSNYDSVTALTTNQTFYPSFGNIATTGNTIQAVSSTFAFNPGAGSGTLNVGTLVTATVNAATIGNTGAALTGATLTTSSTASVGTTLTATTINAATIGNIGANVVGTGTYLTALNGANLNGTVPTANVAYYDVITPLSNNQTYYLEFANVTTGNSVTGAVTTVNVNPSTSTISALAFAGGSGAFTTLSASGIATLTNSTDATSTGTGALQVTGGVGIGGNLWVGGNIYAANLFATTSSILTIEDPLVYLYAAGNTTQYNYDIGIYSDYSAPGYRHTGLARNFNANVWTFFSNVLSEPTGTTINWNDAGIAYDTVKAGSLILANSTVASSTATGALQVSGGAGIVGSAYIGGGVQNTPIGNATPNTGAFTTLSATGASTLNTVTGASFQGVIGNVTPSTATFTTATTGGLQAVAIGNVTPGTGAFTTLTAGSFQGIIGNVTPTTAFFTTANATTVQAATIGNVGAAFTGATLTTSGVITSSGNIVAASGTTSTSTTTGALVVVGGTGISGNLNVGGITNFAGNVTHDGGMMTIYDSIIDLHTYGNLAAWASDDGKDIGIRMHYYKGADKLAFLGWENTTQTLYYLQDATETNSNVSGVFGNVQFGSLFLSNTTQATGTTVGTGGAFYVAGGAAVSGNVFLANAVTINSSQTAGSDVIVKGKNDGTLIWARPNATYDTVIVGGSAVAANVVNGAKLNIYSTDSLLLPVGTNAQRPSSIGYSDVTGMFRYSTTQGAIEWYNGSSWQAASTSFTVIADQQFNGTGSQTVFTLPSSQTTNSCIVSINGVIQIPTLAYAVTSGTTLTFTEAPASGDVIDVRMLTTTQTVTGITSTNGYMQFLVDNNGAYVYTGSSSTAATTYWDTSGGKVSAIANVSVASANTLTTLDSFSSNSYRTAKYIIQVKNGANYQAQEVLVVTDGTTATQVTYGTVQTSGNLGIIAASQSGSTTTLSFIAANATNTVRIQKDYLAI